MPRHIVVLHGRVIALAHPDQPPKLIYRVGDVAGSFVTTG